MEIEKFWHDIITQNKTALSAYFCDDAVIRWHCTNEKFTVDEYIRANCEYPGKWEGEVERMEAFDSKIILVGKVHSIDTTISCHVVTFIKLRDDKICEMDEYWADDGEIPSWRIEMGNGSTIGGNMNWSQIATGLKV